MFGGTPGAGEPFGLARADRAAASVAVGAMNDPDVGVRRVAAEILGDFDTPDAVPALIRGVDDDDPEVRATALRSLARTEAFAASDAVPERLSDPVPEVRLAALEALDALRADRSRARSLLADPDGLVRARAAGILLKDAPRTGRSRDRRAPATIRRRRRPWRGSRGLPTPRCAWRRSEPSRSHAALRPRTSFGSGCPTPLPPCEPKRRARSPTWIRSEASTFSSRRSETAAPCWRPPTRR